MEIHDNEELRRHAAAAASQSGARPCQSCRGHILHICYLIRTPEMRGYWMFFRAGRLTEGIEKGPVDVVIGDIQLAAGHVDVTGALDVKVIASCLLVAQPRLPVGREARDPRIHFLGPSQRVAELPCIRGDPSVPCVPMLVGILNRTGAAKTLTSPSVIGDASPRRLKHGNCMPAALNVATKACIPGIWLTAFSLYVWNMACRPSGVVRTHQRIDTSDSQRNDLVVSDSLLRLQDLVCSSHPVFCSCVTSA